MAGKKSPDDPVVVFRSKSHDAEQEALLIHGVLEASGISSTVLGDSRYPIFEFRVEVARAQEEEAKSVIADARAAGPSAAAEAEADSESEDAV